MNAFQICSWNQSNQCCLSNLMPCLPHATTDNSKVEMKTTGLNSITECCSEFGTSGLFKYVICYRYIALIYMMRRISGCNDWKKLKFVGSLFLNQKPLWYSAESWTWIRSHECSISVTYSPYPCTSYFITLSLMWPMEIIFFPHGVAVKMKYKNVCDIPFLVGII